MLGRANFPPSHKQATQASSFKVISTVAHNPKLAVKAGGDRILLLQGESCKLSSDYKICLLSADAEHFLQLAEGTGEEVGGHFGRPAQSQEELPQSEAERPSATLVISHAEASDSMLQASEANRLQQNTAQPAALPHSSPNGRHPVLLMLVGAPGAGKSTFAGKLCAASPLWERVNQDTVKGGRRGSRQQCLSLARRILCHGGCTIIDRCHVEAEQREDFLQLARELDIPAHAVVLNIPASQCAEQAMARVQHEGNVDGPGARQVAFSMAARLKREGMPVKSEGLQSILVCESHRDIARALAVWEEYPTSSQSPEEAFRSKGGGKGRLQTFFAPVKAGKQPSARNAASTMPPVVAVATAQKPLPAGGAPLLVASDDRLLKRKAMENVSEPLLAEESGKYQRVQHDGTSAPPENPPPEQLTTISDRSSVAAPSSRQLPVLKRNAFAEMMAASTRAKPVTPSKQPAVQSKNLFARGPFADELHKVALNPERERSKHSEMVVADEYVIVQDKYPKARCHGLAIARDPGLAGPADLTAAHLPLLQKMKEGSRRWVENRRKERADLGPVRIGFHSLPSLRQLHLHIISQDFDSPSLKNKKHWNSFTTDYFLLLSDAERQLQEHGSLSINASAMKDLLSKELQCHKCKAHCKNMPTLKSHIAGCQAELLPTSDDL